VSAGLEFHVDSRARSTTLNWTGVPPVAGFRTSFENLMAAEGVPLEVEEG
jgi:hypothetical protein